MGFVDDTTEEGIKFSKYINIISNSSLPFQQQRTEVSEIARD
jgi:hypothetical protein